MDEVNEKTSSFLTASFYDEDNAAVVPSFAAYRIEDVTTKQEIVAWTAMTPLATAIDIEITDAQNSILSNHHPYETRKVTVYFAYGSGKKGTEYYEYKLKNLGIGEIGTASASPSISASASAS